MSTSWTFLCLEHNIEADGSINHGEDYLRYVWSLRKELAALHEADVNGDLDVGHFMWSSIGGFGSIYNFVAVHKDCAVVLHNEYGDDEPINPGTCEASLSLSSSEEKQGWSFTCSRGVHAVGKHHYRDRSIVIEWDDKI